MSQIKFSKNAWLIFMSLLIFSYAQSQNTISGIVKTDTNETLIGATVTINMEVDSAILAYGITDDDGKFNIKINSDLESFYLNISYIGFKKWSFKVENKTSNFIVTLESSEEKLDEILLDYKPIEKNGDTINYSVASFTDKNDRVIGDIIKKLPGIEVQPGGQILYQGKPIQKYYIEGLDLLEGRYNLANNNLSVEDVSKVQILENHQPIKILDSLISSDRASLNIKLKKDITVSGSAKLGTGLPALLWEVNVTPILLTKKRQALTSYQTNNIGIDLSKEITNFYSSISEPMIQTNKKAWLNIMDPSSPTFKKERWLDNNAHLGSTNVLWRLKKDFDLKVNLSYINDTQSMIGSNKIQYITPNDTINLVENTQNAIFKKNLQSKLIIEQNTDENYFRNELEINGFWDSKRGKIINNGSDISNTLKNPFSIIKNNLQLYKTIGSQLLIINSIIGNSKTNQDLNINPGQFSDLVNNGNNYNTSIQTVSNSKFFTHNTVGFTKAIKKITVSPELGFALQNENLVSQFKIDNLEVSSDFENDTNFKQLKLYAKSDFEFKSDNWVIKLNTPINYQVFNVKDKILENNNNKEYLTFEPTVYISKKISPYWDMNISYIRKNNFGAIDITYSGFILSNYRNISRYNSLLPESLLQNYSLGFSFRKPLKGFFTNINYSFSVSNNNLLYTTNIESNGSIFINALKKNNEIKSHNLNLSTSKRLRKLKSILNLNTSYTIFESQQLLNNDFTDSENRNLLFILSFDSSIAKWLSTSLKSNVSILNTKLQEVSFNTIVRQQHEFKTTAYVSENQNFSVSSELYDNNISSQNGTVFFMNFGYNYRLKKSNIDLYVKWLNITNERDYLNVFNSEYSSIETRFNMRPSQIFTGLKISF